MSTRRLSSGTLKMFWKLCRPSITWRPSRPARPGSRRARRRLQILEPHDSCTSTAKGTVAIMPRIVGVSSCSTWCRIRRRPRALTVASCVGDIPMMLRTSVTLSFFGTGRLLRVAVERPAPCRVRGLQPLEPAEGVHRRLQHVVRVVGTEGLGQDVLHPRRLQHRPHRAARDDPGALRRRLQVHPRGAEVTGDLARDRGVLQRHLHQVLLGVLHRLADRLGDLAGLAEPDTHVPLSVAHHHQRREGESTAALDDLGHPVDGDHPVGQVQRIGINPRFSHSMLLLESQARGACRVGQGLHPSVVLIAAAIEHDLADAARLRPLGQQLSHDLGRGHVAARLHLLPEVRGPAVHRGERATAGVVDHLRVDVVQAPEHRQPRTLRGADHPGADAQVADLPSLDLLAGQHYLAPAFLPTFRRMYSSEYLMPLPLYGSGFRSARSLAAVWPSSALSAPRKVIETWRSTSAWIPSGSGKMTGCEYPRASCRALPWIWHR